MIKYEFTILVLAILLLVGCNDMPGSKEESSATAGIDLTVLPISEPERPVYIQLDVHNAKPPPRFEVKAPAGAPNVLVVLIDDLGFGGPVVTSTFDRIANEGLYYNNFHTTAVCSPTRAVLLGNTGSRSGRLRGQVALYRSHIESYDRGEIRCVERVVSKKIRTLLNEITNFDDEKNL